jgi:hypothetical protein
LLSDEDLIDVLCCSTNLENLSAKIGKVFNLDSFSNTREKILDFCDLSREDQKGQLPIDGFYSANKKNNLVFSFSLLFSSQVYIIYYYFYIRLLS